MVSFLQLCVIYVFRKFHIVFCLHKRNFLKLKKVWKLWNINSPFAVEPRFRHKGIQGNNNVDITAKSASKKPRIYPPALLPKSDTTSFAHRLIGEHWHSLWRDQIPTGNKLVQLKNSPVPWPSSQQPKRWVEIILSRLRIGYNRLTHSHLFSNLFPLTLSLIHISEPTRPY